MSNKWVEVEAKTIDDAIKAGLKELSLEDATQANINILREPEGGVFGVGGTKALVRISVRNGAQSNNRNGNSRGSNSHNNNQSKRTPKTYEKRNHMKKNQELKLILKSNLTFLLNF